MPDRVDVYRGHIAGLGTASGRRLVVGRWLDSPYGSFADVMVEDASGHRTLLAPRADVADEISATYAFDAVHVVDVRVSSDARSRTWRVTAGPLDAALRIGARTGVGRLLAAVPAALASAEWFAAAADPVARVVLTGVRTRGSAGGGRTETYAASDQHEIVAADASWAGEPCGALAAVEPPVGFGFSSVPARPSVTRVRTTIRRPR
ncbi:hypothetical protein [Cellulomonas edaphi]|uniref:Uncharacterized protein n=1 Tax=Cellulomonas edaphi TaxID=3053468 RepID=A0ABT7S8I3_9CELL|nr:hypothetical protein [Cellulomons edaphi]MDM7831244.1 hypothetical protein [Cellulomons edaphi]